MPDALVITAAGINCDLELVEAFELAGASVESIHLNRLMAEPELIDRFDLVGLPGGFSFGDAVAAGRIAAGLMRRTLYGPLVRAIERGVPMIAPCNGFQVAAQLGLLPGPFGDDPWPASPPPPTVALAPNDSARFVDRWCGVAVPANTRCIWTEGLELGAETSLLPVAHAEGRFLTASPEVLERLEADGRIAVRYAATDNPNGSEGDVAGICDRSGLVLGLMPHPERYTRWTQHPRWTRLSEADMAAEPPGLAMFRRAVAHVASGCRSPAATTPA